MEDRHVAYFGDFRWFRADFRRDWARIMGRRWSVVLLDGNDRAGPNQRGLDPFGSSVGSGGGGDEVRGGVREGVRGDGAEIRGRGVHGRATEVEERVQAHVRVPALAGSSRHSRLLREDSVLGGYSGIREREFCLVGREYSGQRRVQDEQQLEGLEVSLLCCGYGCHESEDCSAPTGTYCLIN